ncbi:MAG: 4-hydroxy-tetrahydrodipicolinate reductase [Vampirovibrionales bacterium]|nr:4-hydroxy-tetrahydrodipicolinate reductase [Vampirovibrionales bacterium]
MSSNLLPPESCINGSIGVVIVGATGNMGKEAVKAVLAQPDMTLLGAVGRRYAGEDAALIAGEDTPCGVTLVSSLVELLSSLKTSGALEPYEHWVGIELTNPTTVMEHTNSLVQAGFRPVIGTSGVEEAQQKTLNRVLTSASLGGAVIPNFAIGAVLMMRFAKEAAQYFDNVEIVELHHNKKLDAPSGTAHHTALSLSEHHPHPFNAALVKEAETITGARGAEFPNGVRVHSVRLPGLVAHQEVLLASEGQLLTIRHDSFNRQCFMPGVLRAIRGVTTHSGLKVGLEHYLQGKE